MATKKIIIRDWSSFKHPLEINLIVWILSRCSYYLGATVYSRGNLISVVWCSFFVPSYVLSQCVYFADKACHCDLNFKMNIFIWHDDAAHSASFFSLIYWMDLVTISIADSILFNLNELCLMSVCVFTAVRMCLFVSPFFICWKSMKQQSDVVKLKHMCRVLKYEQDNKI